MNVIYIFKYPLCFSEVKGVSPKFVLIYLKDTFESLRVNII